MASNVLCVFAYAAVSAFTHLIHTQFPPIADLYMSDVYPHPNPANHTWVSESYMADSITIPGSKLHFGPYYISVRAFSNLTFTIVAHFEALVMLQDGVAQVCCLPRCASVWCSLHCVMLRGVSSGETGEECSGEQDTITREVLPVFSTPLWIC